MRKQKHNSDYKSVKISAIFHFINHCEFKDHNGFSNAFSPVFNIVDVFLFLWLFFTLLLACLLMSMLTYFSYRERSS